MQPGKGVVELQPAGRDKGTCGASSSCRKPPFRGRMPVFIGDDVTDEYAFAIVNALNGCSVKVGPGTTAAKWRLPDVNAVRDWLERATPHYERSHMTSLDLATDRQRHHRRPRRPIGEIVWGCFPRFDSDPAFCSLLREHVSDDDYGFYRDRPGAISNAPSRRISRTRRCSSRGCIDRDGGCVEITDCAPRFMQHGRMFCPMTLVRQVTRVAGSPQIRIRVRPARDAGEARRGITVRQPPHSLHRRRDRPALDHGCVDHRDRRRASVHPRRGRHAAPRTRRDSLQDTAAEVGRHFAEETIAYWRDWVRSLAIPFEWQEAVIRAAITLQLNAFDDTGAIIAAVTTSIPEAADSGRNWDYRYCWLRDGYLVVHALNRLGATRTMERYLRYIVNIAAGVGRRAAPARLRDQRPPALDEREVASLPGYRGMGPVRVGNDAYGRSSTTSYGAAILAATHVFFDERLVRADDIALFERLEALGERAAELYDQPDAGLWEFRGHCARAHVLERDVLGRVRSPRAHRRASRARRSCGILAHDGRTIHRVICERCWNPQLGELRRHHRRRHARRELAAARRSSDSWMPAIRALRRRSARSSASSKRGDFIFRYVEEDDFGVPMNAFLVCTFWYVNALAALGRRDEARTLFETLLACRNRHGLLAEHVDPVTRRAVGQLRADLQHGRAHQLRDASLAVVGSRFLMVLAPSKSNSRRAPKRASSDDPRYLMTALGTRTTKRTRTGLATSSPAS